MNSVRLKGIHLAMRHRDACGRDGVRGRSRQRCFRGAASSATRRAINDSDVRRELYPVRNVHQSFEHGLLAGMAFSGLSLVTGGWWIQDPMPSRAGHERTANAGGVLPRTRRRIQIVPVTPVEDRSSADVRPADERALFRARDTPRISRRTSSSTTPTSAARAAGKNTAIRARGSVPRTSTRWSTPATARSACRSTRRTASTARPATSWTRTRSSTGCRPKGAAGRLRRDVASEPRGRPRALRTMPESPLTPFQLAKASTIASSRRLPSARCVARSRGTSKATNTTTPSSAAGRQPILACWHGRILPGLYHFRNRGIVAITSQNFDGEWIARILSRSAWAPRGDRRRAGGPGRWCRCSGIWPRAGRSSSPSTALAARRASPSRAPPGWPAPRASRSCRFTSRRIGRGRCELGSGADSQALHARRGDAWRRDRRFTRLEDEAIEGGRVEIERALENLETRARRVLGTGKF